MHKDNGASIKNRIKCGLDSSFEVKHEEVEGETERNSQ
jgi:hypothetical protein